MYPQEIVISMDRKGTLYDTNSTVKNRYYKDSMQTYNARRNSSAKTLYL